MIEQKYIDQAEALLLKDSAPVEAVLVEPYDVSDAVKPFEEFLDWMFNPSRKIERNHGTD